MHFEFQSKIYSSSAEMHRAIAQAHLDDGGHNDLADQLAYLASHTDAECADAAIEQWLLEEAAWAAPRAFSRSDLIEAYEALRKKTLSARAPTNYAANTLRSAAGPTRWKR